MLCTEPLVALICLIIFIMVVAWTKYVSLGSIIAVAVYPMILNRMTGIGVHNLIAIIIMILVIFLHRANIKRVWAGKENKISFKKKTVGRGVPDAPPEKKEE